MNTAAIIPGADGTVFSLTAVNVTKLFPIDLQEGKLVAVSFGRYNLVDLIEEHFFAGGGTERFFNIAQIGPLTVWRQVPQDLSNVLKDNLDLLRLGGRLRVEHQVEVFYNLHLTPWFQLTGDLQILRPNRPVADTAIVPAVRVRFVF